MQTKKKTGKTHKIQAVTDLIDKVGKAKAIVFTDYRGLKHKQLEELRKSLKKVNGELVVAKNRLILRALGDRAEAVKGELIDVTAVLFSYKDEVSPLKEVVKFFQNANVGKTKGGLLAGAALTDKQVMQLSELPSREVLLSKMVGSMKAPLYGLHHALSWNLNKLVWVLNGVKEKKS